MAKARRTRTAFRSSKSGRRDRRDAALTDSGGVTELQAALALAEIPGVGPARLRALLDRWGSAVDVLRVARHPHAHRDFPGDLRRTVASLLPLDPTRLAALESRGIRVAAYGRDGYPEELRHLHHPPVVLYMRGPARLDPGRTVAVVGTRSATSYGRRMARDLAKGLVARGWAVVSGLARGIDGEAHRATLDAGGTTVGVLGCGLDHVAPRRHRALYRSVAETGLLVSEFPPELAPAPGLFPRRNRIIAALARGVVVVQAGSRSGALITVHHALELGREVFAVPGPAGVPASEGVHEMLRDGATLATSAADVDAGLGDRPTSGPPQTEPDPDEARERRRREAIRSTFSKSERPAARAICRELADEPREVDDLARACGLDAGSATALLERLVLAGVLRGLPGGRYGLTEPSSRSPAPDPGGRS